MQVEIIESETRKVVASIPIVLAGPNSIPSEQEFFQQAWRAAVADASVDPARREDYTFRLLREGRTARMNPLYLGDSYDIVKRFFCEAIRNLGYTVYIDPMFTGAWAGEDEAFGKFLGVTHMLHRDPIQTKAALFFDPDTGVKDTQTTAHVSFDRLAQAADVQTLVFAFDQSFSKNTNPREQMMEKLAQMHARQCHGFYYDAHARFLFVSRDDAPLRALEEQLCGLGLPARRLVRRPA
jgi:hypothetical protein